MRERRSYCSHGNPTLWATRPPVPTVRVPQPREEQDCPPRTESRPGDAESGGCVEGQVESATLEQGINRIDVVAELVSDSLEQRSSKFGCCEILAEGINRSPYVQKERVRTFLPKQATNLPKDPAPDRSSYQSRKVSVLLD